VRTYKSTDDLMENLLEDHSRHCVPGGGDYDGLTGNELGTSEEIGMELLSTCILRENSSFSRKGPVAASPCKGMGQCHLTNPVQGEFASKKCSNMF
jgi:hypothetical protein